MSIPHSNLIDEFHSLQERLNELRVLLRKEIAGETLPDEPFKTLIARTDRETVGILVRNIDEVLPICRLVPVPEAGHGVRGLLNLGGEMVPVLDLGAKMSGTQHETDLSDMIVICMVENQRVGLIVNEVLEIESMDRTAVQAVPETLSTAPYLLGASEIGGSTVLILDVPSVARRSGLSETISR